ILARPISNLERALRWTKRNPLMATTAALIVFLAIAGPTAAIRIDQLRTGLKRSLTEKDHLIDQSARENQAANAKINDLSKQLDVWNGRTNPWDFWPPRRDKPPREKL